MRADMKKLRIAFRNFAIAHNKRWVGPMLKGHGGLWSQCCYRHISFYFTDWLRGAESFLRSWPVLSYSRNSPHFVQTITAFTVLCPWPRLSVWMVSKQICCYGEQLLAPRTNPKLEDHLLSNVRDCLFNTFAATLHIEGRSSIRNPRTRNSVMTGTHLSWLILCTKHKRKNSVSMLKNTIRSRYLAHNFVKGDTAKAQHLGHQNSVQHKVYQNPPSMYSDFK